MRARPARIALLCAVMAWQPLTCQGRELKLATWDLGWLTLRAAGKPALPENVRPKAPEDVARLAEYARRLDADIVAFQGVDDEDAARAVFPKSAYALVLAAGPVRQHTGFAVRRGLDILPHADVASLDPYPGARLPLRRGADIGITDWPHG